MKIILTERAKELEQTERTLYRKENEVKELLGLYDADRYIELFGEVEEA